VIRTILVLATCLGATFLDGCTALPVSQMSLGTNMVTSGGSGKWQEIPMTAIQTKDPVFMVTYVRWEPFEQSAGTHDIKWAWYREGKVVHRCNVDSVVMNKSPYRIWCRMQAAALGVGHYRIELSIDNVPFAMSEFDIIDVVNEAPETRTSYQNGSPPDAPKGEASSLEGSKGELLSHCPNVLAVARGIGFPPEAARNGLREGAVTVSMVLAPGGSIKSVKILASTDRSFDQATIDAVTRLQCNGNGLTKEKEIRWEMSYKAQ